MRNQTIWSRSNIVLVLLTVCLTNSGCLEVEPAVNTPVGYTSKDDLAEYEAIAKEIRKSAEAGDASAQNRLGVLYNEGKGVPQDHRQAKEWLEMAAKQEHAGAQVNLGTLYFQGHGAPQSDQMALFWFSRSAEQGEALALGKLGWMYEQGRGVRQDFVQAHKWYNLSAGYGQQRGAEARDAIAQKMTPSQIAEAQQLAREWKPKDKIGNSF